MAVASHDDDTSEKVALMHDFGATISEFPVTLEAAQSAKEKGMFVAMGAPNALRGGSHSGNLSAVDGIRAGAVDVLAADYHPASLPQSVFALEGNGVLPQFGFGAALRDGDLGERQRGAVGDDHAAQERAVSVTAHVRSRTVAGAA